MAWILGLRGSRSVAGGDRRIAIGLSVVFTTLAAVSLVMRRYEVVGRSMEPTLLQGDRLLVVKSPRPPTGGIVVLHHAGVGEDMVKRLVRRSRSGVWVQGDNSEYSTDSRQFGWLPRDSVVGWAIYRYYPPERAGNLIAE